MDNLLEKLANKTASIGVIGLGYVGLPLAVEFGRKYPVVGFDTNEDRVAELRRGEDSTLEVEPAELRAAPLLAFTGAIEELRRCNIFIVTVPTPIDRYKRPDLTFLIGASETIGKVLKRGDVVIYESTVYPGGDRGGLRPGAGESVRPQVQPGLLRRL